MSVSGKTQAEKKAEGLHGNICGLYCSDSILSPLETIVMLWRKHHFQPNEAVNAVTCICTLYTLH